MKLCQRCGHAHHQHAPGSGTCMAVVRLEGPPLVSVCACGGYVEALKEPIGRRVLRTAGMALEVTLAAAGMARAVIGAWWASWREGRAVRERAAQTRTVRRTLEKLQRERDATDPALEELISKYERPTGAREDFRPLSSGLSFDGDYQPQTCTRPAPHRCGVSDEPCNGFPRSAP